MTVNKQQEKMAPQNPRGKKHAQGGTTDNAREFELVCVALTSRKYDWFMPGVLTTCCQYSRYM